MKISGKLIRPDKTSLETLLGRLSTIETKGTLVVYEGRRIYHNLMIASFSHDADSKIMNGFNFSMTLKEVRFAQPSYISLPKKTKAAVAGVSSVGRKQTVNKKQSPIYHVAKKEIPITELHRNTVKSGKKFKEIINTQQLKYRLGQK